MRRIGRKISGWCLAGAMILSMLNVPLGVKSVEAAGEAYPGSHVLTTDRDVPRDGNIFVEVSGNMKKQDIAEAIDRINEIRKEACDKGYAMPNDLNGDHSTTETLKPSDYVPVTWSLGLENHAIIRAAEASIRRGHVRPNSKNEYAWDMITINETPIWLENLAYGYNYDGSYSFLDAINGWYSEKDKYLNNGSSNDYGHYQLMINPKIKCVGLGMFNNPKGYYKNYIAGEFAHSQGANDMQASFGYNGSYIQIVELSKEFITGITISGTSIYTKGIGGNMSATVSTNLTDSYTAKVYSGATWTSSDTDVATVSSTGEITALSSGTSTITVSVSNGTSEFTDSCEICVLPEGTTIESVSNPAQITVENRTNPDLPPTVKANLSDGSKIDIAVKWDDYDKKLLNTYFESNDFEIAGNAFGYEVTQKVHVKAYPSSSIKCYPYSSTVTTPSGTAPTLPQGYIMFPDFEYDHLPMDWDQDSVDHYKDRKGGSFVVEGLTATHFVTDNEPVQVPSQFTLKVTPATVTKVVYNENDITVPSGTEPTYPVPEVTWSNGDVDTAASPKPEYGYMVWDETEDFLNGYKKREGGTYTITGRFHDAVNDVDYGTDTMVTVKVSPAYISKVEYDDKDIKVENGTDPTSLLPKEAKITWSNGDVTTEAIEWNKIQEGSYINMTGGEFNATGNVLYHKVHVKIIVAKPKIKSVEEFSTITTLEGIYPELPKEAEVTWNNGKVSSEKIKWDEIPEENIFDVDKTFKVSGTLSEIDDENNKVSIEIKVEPKSLVSLSWKTMPKNTIFYDKYSLTNEKGTLVAEFDNGTTQGFGMDSRSIMWSGYDESSLAPTQTVTFSYTYTNSKGSVTKSVTLDIELHLMKSIQFKPPIQLEYLEGQDLKLKGMAVSITYDNDVVSVIDVANEYAAGTVGDKFTLALLDADENSVAFENLAAGKYDLKINCRSEEDSYVVKVKKPIRDSVAEFDDSTETSFPYGATDEEIIAALVGAEVTVPCASDETVEVILTEDMISEIVTDSQDADGNDIKKITIILTNDAEGDPVVTYAYVTVAKKPEPTPTPTSEPTSGPTADPSEDPSGSPTGVPTGNPDAMPSTEPSGTPTSVPTAEPGVTPTSDPTSAPTELPVAPPGGEDDLTPGMKVYVGEGVYVINEDGSVTFNGTTNKKIKTLVIPDTITIGDKVYPVTTIGKNAFKGYKKLTKVTIGKNVTKIGSKAFYKAKKLKTIIIKTRKLKKKSIGSKAFKGIYKKAKFKCPKSKKKNYKKWIRKAGAPKKAKYK
ncbi:MAG: Ig-like domain-containing protein [Eubacterium sp.]|nr:Ig-like domain-containing protein [Eubacterium sp.]